ncbi:ubiquitin-conjugating enzyme E2 4-like protein [Tanacetum coccineum]
MASQNTRKESDLRKLMMSGYKVETIGDSVESFYVFFNGPPDTAPYQGGVWKVRVDLPVDYPLKAPVISFDTPIYHPNIRSGYGMVCVDVLDDQNWNPGYNLVLIIDHYLPTLLCAPNAEDYMNSNAAVLFSNDTAAYDAKVKEHTQEYAKPKDAGVVTDVGSSAGSGNEVQAVGPGDESRAAGSGNEAAAESTSSGDEAFAAGRVDP